MTYMETCPICGGSAQRTEAPRRVKAGRRSVRIVDVFMACAGCGEEYYGPGQMEASQQRASAALSALAGGLSASEIRAIRMRLGLTQVQLEQLLGVGPKTVVRWERGTVHPNASTDMLLRVLRDVPGAAEYLGMQHGVTFHPRSTQAVGPADAVVPSPPTTVWVSAEPGAVLITGSESQPPRRRRVNADAGATSAGDAATAPLTTRGAVVRAHLQDMFVEYQVN